MRLLLVGLGGLLISAGMAAAQDVALAKRAQAILKENCYGCHGEAGATEGGVNYVLEVPRLISRGKLVAGNAVRSKLYTQVKTGNMPKDSEPLSKADIETLRQWIDAGAPDFNPPAAKREFISPAKMFEFLKADLEAIDCRKRPLIRYFTLTHLYNAGLSDDELATYRNGLAKLINSLSWAPDIVVPQPIDPAKTIFRLDIGDVEWSAATWDRILQQIESTQATGCTP
jgi:mono/diheme cytochrome c family protein